MLYADSTGAPCFKVLGVRVFAVQIPDVIAQMERWIAKRDGCHTVAVTGMHGVTEANRHARFKRVLNSSSLVIPDGMPLVWIARRKGHPLRRRTYGPELMDTFVRTTGPKYRHFLYGGKDGVADRLARTLAARYGAKIAGVYSPPFRPLRPEERDDVIKTINSSNADVLWVGLSTPKQEIWMDEYKDRLRVPVALGVGAAFDINSGLAKQAPPWMREHGFEWLFRLLSEPRRLWRRYLLYGPEFVFNVACELLSVRKFE